ncbi:hypothetical protein [Dactylosporangium sp. NPDC051541]|uniref:hypothetical protein n=1 Tax=Dactylosporangium sp. NPDC051541 TaxID=3363977 RepID=UPI0037998B8F
MFLPHGNANCWDALDSVCHPQILVRWTADSADGDFFCPSVGAGGAKCPVANQIHLTFNAPDGSTPVHELGHAVMWDAYEHDTPFDADCTAHQLGVPLSAECAWSEGWADRFAILGTQNKVLTFPNGVTVDFEDTHMQAWDAGEAVQGRVTAALQDLADGANGR